MKRAFHELLDEDCEDVDMHEMFRVMCTAFQCIMSNPDLRPCMSEVTNQLVIKHMYVYNLKEEMYVLVDQLG